MGINRRAMHAIGYVKVFMWKVLQKVRRFTKGGGGCRWLRGWRVFDGFESYAGK